MFLDQCPPEMLLASCATIGWPVNAPRQVQQEVESPGIALGQKLNDSLADERRFGQTSLSCGSLDLLNQPMFKADCQRMRHALCVAQLGINSKCGFARRLLCQQWAEFTPVQAATR